MTILYSLLLCCALCAMTSPGLAQDEDPFDLNAYRWHNRLVVVFAEKAATPAYQDVVQEIATVRNAFDDRDMVLISLFEQEPGSAEDRPIPLADANRLRQKFEIATGSFRVYLIGKDGGVKKEGSSEIRMQDLFNLIDTMPMRRNEMRRKSSG